MALAAWICVAAGPGRAQAPASEALEARVADLFENRCAKSGCHVGPTPQMGMDLARGQYYASVVGEPSLERPELMRVNPGQPEISYLVMKIKAAEGIIGTQMPLVGDELSDQEVQLVVDWVRSIDAVDQAKKAAAKPSRAYPFAGSKIVNLPTTMSYSKGSQLFMIQHRLNPAIRTGYDTFYGIDGSGVILLSLGYAITDNLNVWLGRSNSDDVVELQARYLAARQSVDGGWPLDVGVTATMDWVTQDPPGDEDRLRSEAFKFAAQVILARELPWNLGVAVVPGILFNTSETIDDEDPLITIGLGARWRFTRNQGVVAEWVPIADGYVRTATFGNDIRWDSWGAGYEIATGGHVFQIVVSNTVGLTTDQYMRGGDLDPEMPDMRLGFNISRVLNFW